MKTNQPLKRIAILGAGPAGLFMYKRLLETNRQDLEIHIFERQQQLGAGMPYSLQGAGVEHVTNVSDNEVPSLVTPMTDWVQTAPEALLQQLGVDRERFHEYKVVPRLLFGHYLSTQFHLLQQQARQSGMVTHVHLGSLVTDIIDLPDRQQVQLEVDGISPILFDYVIICTGHHWPIKHEGTTPHFFDSPYPPAKLVLKVNHAVALKGASLTAIDAIRTLARSNGRFSVQPDGKLVFERDNHSPDFKLVMHSKNGLLPAIRFHLEEALLSQDSQLTPEQISANQAQNDGFLSLDYVFKKNFKDTFREKDPGFYEKIRPMTLEQFVDSMMEQRERQDPFTLFRAEYAEAEQSIRRHQSIYWKEMLAVLSYTLNYPAKYFSAEDMQRLQKVLMPLISIVIAFVPQRSAQELLALHEAGVLELIAVGDDSHIEPENRGGATYHYTDENGTSQKTYYKTYVDCVGQPHLAFEDFPFKSLLTSGAVSPARIRFRSNQNGQIARQQGAENVEVDASGNYFLKVPGITITDSFQIVDDTHTANNRIFIMAVPYIGGYNPDYSGLDFCETASDRISHYFQNHEPSPQNT